MARDRRQDMLAIKLNRKLNIKIFFARCPLCGSMQMYANRALARPLAPRLAVEDFSFFWANFNITKCLFVDMPGCFCEFECYLE